MPEENNVQIASEQMVRNAQDLFGALYHQNQIFQENYHWIDLDKEEQQNHIYNMWVNSSSEAKLTWVKTAQKYLEYHSPDYRFVMKGIG